MNSISRKYNSLKTGCLAVWMTAGLFFVTAAPVQAQSGKQVEAALEILKDVEPDDLPWKSVELVAGAPKKAQLTVAAAVVKAISILRIESTPACVGAIAAQIPSCALSGLASGLEHAPKYAVVTCVTVGSLDSVSWQDVESIAIASAPNPDESLKIKAILRQLRSGTPNVTGR
jgi:hypothetical protein